MSNRHSPEVQSLAAKLAEYANLEHSEEKCLLTLAQDGDVPAQQRVVESVALLVLDMAMSFSAGRSDRILDNFQEGILGVYKAIEKYDGSFKVRFYTFAWYHIRAAMQRSVQLQQRGAVESVASLKVVDPHRVGAELELAEQQEAWRAYVATMVDRINSLPPAHSRTLLAHMYQGETPKAAAERHGCTRQRIQQILAMSQARLQEILEPCPAELQPSNWDYACCG